MLPVTLTLTAMENTENNPAPHPPTDKNPYPYPLQKKNRKGWLYALITLVAVAVVVTVVCLVVGIYDHHQEVLDREAAESIMTVP